MQINPNFCVCEDGGRGRINHKADVERIISMALCTTISKTNEYTSEFTAFNAPQFLYSLIETPNPPIFDTRSTKTLGP